MKFTDGQWLLQSGVSAHYPAEAYAVDALADKIVVLAPTRRIQHRGDTLAGPVLTVTLSSPLEGVIKVRIEHYSSQAGRRPTIPLEANPAPAVEVKSDDEAATLRSGSLEARVRRKGEWEVSFRAGGKVLTKSAWRGMGYAQWQGHGNFVHEQLSLGVGENVYGLGERFTAYVKNGQTVENWNKDGGTSSEQTYKNVPFYLTNRGYGVLVNETGPVSFEVASEKVARVQFSLPGESLEYFIIHGPTPKEILARLTALTGRPALPPAWSFGLWLSTSFTTNYDEATVTSFIAGMEERKLPLSVFHFDCFWMREFEWCNFEWDPRQFPDPKGMLQRLKARGLKICVWINPYIAQRSKLFAEGEAGGYFLKRPDGSVWQTDLWQPGMAIVDFTNPAAREWYKGHLRRLMDMGVDVFKTDFGERIPTDVVYHDGSDPVAMHNLYAVQYNETVFRLLEQVRGKGDAVVFARSAYASSQRFPLHWGGDCWSNFESMAESLRGGLSLSLCGFGYWSHDIGGFEGNPPPEVYKRWLAFGLLSSHSRLHGSSSYRVPWSIDEESCDVLRTFTQLKCRLMPYLYSAAVEAHAAGVPMMRAMMLEFPDDPACETLDRQYMLGGSLLVAPVLTADGVTDYYLPAGRWTHAMTGEVQEGGRWHRAQHGFLSLPLFVRPGTVLATGPRDDRPDYDFAEGVTFQVYELADGASATCKVHADRGAEALTFTISRKGKALEATCTGAKVGAWAVKLAGIASASASEGSVKVEKTAGGIVATPACGARGIRLLLPA
ncbi:alpha-xylosidase [mine drainage metagenome]|uniref:alpha-D-xyloside xylohydrolase n=1 Tax=mine drainage metagenome TaxID=410659 RepID=A0A1J5S0V3_9ZZZZ